MDDELAYSTAGGWYGDLGNLQVMPTTGEFVPDREKAKSPFSHDREEARAGYYSVMLDRYDIRAELAAAPRAGIIRFTYPRSAAGRIQVDLARRIGQKSRWLEHGRQSVKLVDDHTVEGRMHCPHEDGGWGMGGGRVTFTQHFSMQFSRPVKTFGVWYPAGKCKMTHITRAGTSVATSRVFKCKPNHKMRFWRAKLIVSVKAVGGFRHARDVAWSPGTTQFPC